MPNLPRIATKVINASDHDSKSLLELNPAFMLQHHDGIHGFAPIERDPAWARQCSTPVQNWPT